MRRRALGGLAVALAIGIGALPGVAQEEDDEGLGPAPGEARAIVARAIEAMGGAEALDRLTTAVMTVTPGEGQVRERYALRLDGRYLHYASRRASGAGFDVVLARGLNFFTDLDRAGQVVGVQDLEPGDVAEAGYERDVRFMPLLLPALLRDETARLDLRGRTSTGEHVVRALVRPPSGSPGEPFLIRLRFDPRTDLLSGSMGHVPSGPDQGKKRYTSYLEYRDVGAIRLPHRITDLWGEATTPQEFALTWTVGEPLPADLFVRPRNPVAEGEAPR